LHLKANFETRRWSRRRRGRIRRRRRGGRRRRQRRHRWIRQPSQVIPARGEVLPFARAQPRPGYLKSSRVDTRRHGSNRFNLHSPTACLHRAGRHGERRAGVQQPLDGVRALEQQVEVDVAGLEVRRGGVPLGVERGGRPVVGLALLTSSRYCLPACVIVKTHPIDASQVWSMSRNQASAAPHLAGLQRVELRHSPSAPRSCRCESEARRLRGRLPRRHLRRSQLRHLRRRRLPQHLSFPRRPPRRRRRWRWARRSALLLFLLVGGGHLRQRVWRARLPVACSRGR
jgi:hypothetical protein